MKNVSIFDFSCINGCGLFGKCVNINQCECKPGWKNSFDSLFFLEIEDLNDDEIFQTLPCSENPILLRTLYGVASVLGFLSIIYLFLEITRRPQLLRATAPLLAITSGTILGIYKNIRTGRENVFGNDYVIGVLVTFIIPGSMFAMLVFVNKYILFQTRLLKAEKSSKVTTWTYQVIAFFVTLVATIFLLLAVFLKDPKTRTLMLRFSASLCLLLCLWIIIVVRKQFSFFIVKLQEVRLSLLEDDIKDKLVWYFTFLMWFQISLFSLIIIVGVIGIASDSTLHLFTWFVVLIEYIMLIVYLGTSTIARKASRLHKKKRSKLLRSKSKPKFTLSDKLDNI